MAAYSAVASFRRTLEQLMDSDQLPLDISKPQIESLYERVSFLQSCLDKIGVIQNDSRDEMNKQLTRVREAIYVAEDIIDYWITKGHLPVRSDGISFDKAAEDVVKEAVEMVEAIQRSSSAQKLFTKISQPPKSMSMSGRKKKIVGQKKDFELLVKLLEEDDKQLLIIPIIGLPGLGKSTLARSIYEDPGMMSRFDIFSWINVSQDFKDNPKKKEKDDQKEEEKEKRRIYSKILSSLESEKHHPGHYTTQGDEKTLRNRLHQELENQRYLMVVEDLREASGWESLRNALPENKNGSRVLITTSIQEVAAIQSSKYIHEMQSLSLEDSWELLCDNVFGDKYESCPLHLREIGWRIAENCKGLPVSITVIGGILSQKKGEIEHWKMIEEDTTGDSSHQDILSLSYKYLPPKLKRCFIFTARFPRNSKIPLSRLIELWIDQRFFEKSTSNQKTDDVAWDSLRELVERNLIPVINSRSSNGLVEVFDMHDSLRELAKERGRNENFDSKKIVGQKADFRKVTDMMYSDFTELLVIPITGMPGLGKTTLARSIYEDPRTKSEFDIRAWVTVSQDYNYQEILSKMLSSMESKNYLADNYTTQGDEQELRNSLHQQLYNQRYLIVIDDVWETSVWERLKHVFPDSGKGSCILVTTRIPLVAQTIASFGYFHEMQSLSVEDSWELLCESVFGDDPCPPHLKEIGLKIAKKCKGLPLSIVVIGGVLSRENANEEYWKRIEEDNLDAVTSSDSSYMEILSLSYNHLPPKVKGCFLYMGAFPEDGEIRVSKLIKLWIAEGILPVSYHEPLEYVAQGILKELVSRNLILVREVSSIGMIKVCGMHDSLRELAERESKKEKFFYSMKRYLSKQEEDVQMQRRVSVHRNILMCLKEAYNSTQSIENARSLLYLGTHHHHSFPFCLTFDLLRVLDAFTVYFIDFPDEFLKLIHLTYLSLTYNHEIPPEISSLQKLQVLMVRRQPKIIYVGVSFLPDEIWEMPNLRHIWFTETDFPPLPVKVPKNTALLLNLQTLANVNAAYFTDEVLENMPNVKKLSMWMERPEAIKFDLTKLSQLEFFKFVVLNPKPKKGIEVEMEKFFVKTVRRLHLSGTGLPWDYMKFAAENMENLQVLKLKEMAFNGEVWSLDYNLEKLKYMLIEHLEFKEWEASNSNFPCLQKLIVRHCYKLERIPEDFQYIGPLELMEMVDCSPYSVESLEDLKEKSDYYQVKIFTSWE